MQKFKIAYGVLSLVWLVLCVFVFPSSGEAGILPGIATMILTAPIGVIFGYLFAKLNLGLSGELSVLVFTTISLALAYIQWVFFAKVFRKFRQK